MELSKRLQAIVDMISENMVVADLGTDHGYIPIHLIKSGKCSKVYAMDINKGPYLKAKEHVAAHGLSQQITTRISDGMKALNLGEANAIVIAGMGGGLVIKILDQDQRLWPELKEMILQPQSEIHKVREYLLDYDFTIVEENMVYEDGKYYPMMKVVSNAFLKEDNLPVDEHLEYSETELFYGRKLIESKHPVLLEFINKEVEVKEDVLKKLHEQIQVQSKKETVVLSSSCCTLEVERDVIADDAADEKIKALNDRINEINKELELAYEVQRIM